MDLLCQSNKKFKNFFKKNEMLKLTNKSLYIYIYYENSILFFYINSRLTQFQLFSKVYKNNINSNLHTNVRGMSNSADLYVYYR